MSMDKLVRPITLFTAILMTVASAGGLFVEELYRDSALYKTIWRANDAITFLVIATLFFSGYARVRNHRTHVIWMGCILYIFYNYAFYLFGAAFNAFFLIYAALVTVSLYTLFLGISEVRQKEAASYDRNTRYAAAAFLSSVAFPLAIVEVGQCVKFIRTGAVPEMPTLILALDLSMVIPTLLFTAWLLLKKYPLAYTLAGMMLVKSVFYGLVLMTSSITVSVSGLATTDPLLGFYIFVSFGGAVCLLFLLKSPARRVL